MSAGQKHITLYNPNGTIKVLPFINLENRLTKIFGTGYFVFDFGKISLYSSCINIDNFELGLNPIGNKYGLKLYGIVGVYEM